MCFKDGGKISGCLEVKPQDLQSLICSRSHSVYVAVQFLISGGPEDVDGRNIRDWNVVQYQRQVVRLHLVEDDSFGV